MQVAIIAAAIIVAGSVLGSAFLVTQHAQPPQPRYTLTLEVKEMPQDEKLHIIYRLDTITGEVEVCTLERLAPILYVHPLQPAWCAKDFTRKTHP